jgi:carbohydrate-selective porin OprB
MGIAWLFNIPTATFAADPGDPGVDLGVHTNTASLWYRQYILGDWGGWRSRLADQGVTFNIQNIGDFQANLSGSQTHHASYFARLRAWADVDVNKLLD